MKAKIKLQIYQIFHIVFGSKAEEEHGHDSHMATFKFQETKIILLHNIKFSGKLYLSLLLEKIYKHFTSNNKFK